MKKSISMILSLLLVLAIFAGCSSQPTETTKSDQGTTTQGSGDTNNDNPEPFKIGFPWDTASTDPTWISVNTNVRAAVEAAGGELINVDTDLTADGLINNISELISRGVDGILFMPASDTMLPTVDQMCADAGVVWGTMFRAITDPDIKEQIHASEWYAGGSYEDDQACASNIVKAMGDIGVTDLGVINIAKGDTSSDLRDMGAAKGSEESGVNILNTTYGLTVTTDTTKTVESYIAAYPEMNGLLILGTYAPAALPTAIKALEDNNKAGDVKVARIDFESTMGEFFEKGVFHISYGGQQQIDPLMSAVILVNKVIGSPIVEDGPTIIITPYLELTSADEANNYTEYFLGDDAVYTSEEIKELMIKYYNDDYDHDYFVELLKTFSISDVVSRHS